MEWDQTTALKATLRKQLTEMEVERRTTPRSRKLNQRIAAVRSVLAKIDARLNFERVLVPGIS